MRRLFCAVVFVTLLVIWLCSRLRTAQLLQETGDVEHSQSNARLAARLSAAVQSSANRLASEIPTLEGLTPKAFATFVSESALADPALQAFFYGKRPELDFSSSKAMRATLEQGFWFRLPGCAEADLDPSPPTLAERQALMAAAAKATTETRPLPSLCIFSQMRPSKNLAIVALARRLGVTHIIESGRKGGASALVYAVTGFKVTSIELYPMPLISCALSQLTPDIHLLDGDGTDLTRRTVSHIRRSEPAARMAVILDGPKYEGAYKVFQAIRGDVVFAVFDDTYPGTEFRKSLAASEPAVFFSDDPVWLASGLPARDSAKLGEGWPGDEQEPALQFADAWQAMAIVPGNDWSHRG